MAESLSSDVVSLHGHEMHYMRAGSGPALVLLHGVLGSRRVWTNLVGDLARDHTVIAPDLFGHGDSAKPKGDYSLGAFAATVRDLLDELSVTRVTPVGHSLGGGIAMEFAYLFPERVERIVLISSGGLGRELGLPLRAAALPGAGLVLSGIAANWVCRYGELVGRRLMHLGVLAAPDAVEAWRGYVTLGDAETRRAFLATIRAVVDATGQAVIAQDRLYLLRQLPVLLVWGGHDRLIPVSHALATHEQLPGSRLEIFPNAGHFPHLTEPERFATVLRDFLTTPAVRAAG